MKQTTLKKTILLVILILTVAYAGIFSYLNMAKLAEHADSDTASEVLLAREIWLQKDLSPDTWMSSTERKLVSPATLAALFIGLGVPMNLAMGITCIICGGALIAVFMFLMRQAGMGWLGTLTSTLLIMCLPVNGRQVSDSILPYFTYLMYLFADYYTPYVVSMLLSAVVYIRIKNNKRDKLTIALGALTALSTIVLGASGMHILQIAVMPMLVWFFIQLFFETKGFTLKPEKKTLVLGGYVLLLVLSNLVGMMYPSSAATSMYLLSPQQVTERIFVDIPRCILECLGVVGGCRPGSLSGLMHVCVYGATLLMVYAIVIFIKHRRCSENDGDHVGTLLGYFITSLSVSVVAVALTSVAPFQYYFFMLIFVEALALGYLLEHLFEDRKILAILVSIFVAVYGLLNILYTYVPAVTLSDRQDSIREVVDYMEANDIEYGYGQFWVSNRMTVVSEGKVTMGNVYDMSNLTMYWWLTNTEWYVPNLPEKMTTAYVVSHMEESGFLKNLPEDAKMERAFENEDYVVYVSDTNYVGR